jgi:DNA-binding response OmpR family regulator
MEGNPLRNKLELGTARRAEFGPIRLDLLSQTLQVEGSDSVERLTPYEYQMLWVLVRAQGGIVTKSEISDFTLADFPDDADLPTGNGFEVRLRRIREKLRTLTDGRITIENELRMGLRLVDNGA